MHPLRQRLPGLIREGGTDVSCHSCNEPDVTPHSPQVPFEGLTTFLYTGLFLDALMNLLAVLCAVNPPPELTVWRPEGASSEMAFSPILAGTRSTQCNIYWSRSSRLCLEFFVNYPVLCSCLFPPGSLSFFLAPSHLVRWWWLLYGFFLFLRL